MVNNKSYFDLFINKFNLKLNPIILKFICRSKDVNFNLECKYESVTNSYFLDMNHIIEFCNKHRCRCYIRLLTTDHECKHRYECNYFKDYLDWHLNINKINELKKIYGNEFISFKQIDIDNMDELEDIVKYLNHHNIYDIVKIPSKTGVNLVFRSNLNLVEDYLKQNFQSYIFNGLLFNLYIPEFNLEYD